MSIASNQTPHDRPEHICVCIPTYRRPGMVETLLRQLQLQKTDGSFTYSVLVADNDDAQTARAVVERVRQDARVQISCCRAVEKGVAVARNAAVQNAVGDLIAFIDDDELPVDDWLWNLLQV